MGKSDLNGEVIILSYSFLLCEIIWDKARVMTTSYLTWLISIHLLLFIVAASRSILTIIVNWGSTAHDGSGRGLVVRVLVSRL